MLQICSHSYTDGSLVALFPFSYRPRFSPALTMLPFSPLSSLARTDPADGFESILVNIFFQAPFQMNPFNSN